jgi:hypothetical protein
MTDVAVGYLELGLRLGRHVDGLVDSYYGPAEIKERTDTEEPRDPRSLVEDAARLRESLDGLAEQRRNWLKAQLSRPRDVREKARRRGAVFRGRGRALLRDSPDQDA